MEAHFVDGWIHLEAIGDYLDWDFGGVVSHLKELGIADGDAEAFASKAFVSRAASLGLTPEQEARISIVEDPFVERHFRKLHSDWPLSLGQLSGGMAELRPTPAGIRAFLETCDPIPAPFSDDDE